MQKQLEPIIRKMSEELGVPFDICVQAYMSQWHFILEKVNSIDLRNMSVEEFRRTKKNFNIPSIGKLCVTEKKFEGTLKKYEVIKQRLHKDVQDKEDTPDVQRGTDDNESV